MKCGCLPILILISCFWSIVNASDITYIGAVLEYEPYSEVTEGLGETVVRQNAEIIADYARQAKEQNADILVTPEYGIESLDANKTDFTAFLTYMQYVPDPTLKIQPYLLDDSSDNIEAMRILSLAAKENSIYLVVDLGEMLACSDDTMSLSPWVEPTEAEDCPESGFLFYNCQVVFDRSGAVVARYRKQNLFLEPQFSPGPKDNSHAVFVTDFNVRFSLQVCFDIVFENPGYSNVKFLDIKDVIMSTAWVDTLPFYLADAVQNGFSRGLGVNLLVSGYHQPERTKLGSGIFRGYNSDSPVYTYNKDSGNVLLVSSVTTEMYTGSPVHSRSVNYDPIEVALPPVQRFPTQEEFSSSSEEDRTHSMVHLSLADYSHETLEKYTDGKTVDTEVCSIDGDLCCKLSYVNNETEIYKLVAHSGFISVGDGAYSIAVQLCSVIWCRSEAVNSCALVELGVPEYSSFGPFTMSASFIAEMVYPGGLKTDLLLVDNDDLVFEKDFDQHTLTSSKTIENPLFIGLLGRWYSNLPSE